MITTTKRRILALAMALVLALGVIAAAPPALAATMHAVTNQTTFVSAIQNAAHGDTIQLQNDIDVYGQNIMLDGLAVTLDLNGHDLTLYSVGLSTSLILTNGSHLLLEGDGEFNIRGSYQVGAQKGSTFTISNVYTTNSNSHIHSYDEGSHITVLGNAGGDLETTAGTSVSVKDGGEIIVMGNVDGCITGTSGGTLTVYGDVNTNDRWNYLAITGGRNKVDAPSPKLYVHGDVYGNVRAGFATYISIGGNVTTVYFESNASYGKYDSGGVYSSGSDESGGTALVEIGGDILGDSGPSVSRKGAVSVDGEIYTTNSYIRAAKDEVVSYTTAPQVQLGKEDYTTPTTKSGYRTYTNGPGAGTVWVRDSGAEVVAVTGVELNKADLELFVGDTQRLQAAVQPAGATNQRVFWTSSDPDVIEVDQDGTLAAVAPGEATVSVRTDEGDFTASCAVTVDHKSDMPAVSPSSLEMEVGDEQVLTIHMGAGEQEADSATLTGFDSDVIGVSSHTVGGAGTHRVAVTGIAKGNTTITLGWSGGSRHGSTQEIPVRVADSGDTGTAGPDIPSGGFGGGSGGSSKGGSKGGGSSWADGSKVSAAPPAAGYRSSNVNADGSVNGAAIQSELRQAVATTSGDTVTLTTRNAASISPAALKALADIAKDSGKNVVLHADTLSADGRSVQGRLYVEPAKLSGLRADLQLGVYADSAKTASANQLFTKWFGNRLRVVHCGQSGSLHARQAIAAKVNLDGLDASSLVFYSYNRHSNTYTRIANPAYSIDANGYLRVSTDIAGDIIITDQPLKVR